MKRLVQLLILANVWHVSAADLYVNNSGQAGTYTTISAAITAAAAGDRIFVSPYGVYTENLTIAKSLTITSAVANTRFSVVGSVTVTSASNQDVVILGGEFSGGIQGNTGTATLASKGNLTVSDCKASQFITADYIRTKLLFSTITSSATIIRTGYIVGSQVVNISISDGPNVGVGDTLFIIANRLSGALIWNNNDNYFILANNYLFGGQSYISIGVFQYNSTFKNLIINNVVNTGIGSAYGECLNLIGFANANMSNIDIVNNVFQTDATANPDIGCGLATCNTITGFANLYYNIYDDFPNYANPVVGNIDNAGGIVFDSYGKSINGLIVDQGSPALQYYDIDLTRNNLGTFGGPYSIDNYWNTATGRARVYDLNMPFEIWNGSTPSIKAEGTHIK